MLQTLEQNIFSSYTDPDHPTSKVKAMSTFFQQENDAAPGVDIDLNLSMSLLNSPTPAPAVTAAAVTKVGKGDHENVLIHTQNSATRTICKPDVIVPNLEVIDAGMVESSNEGAVASLIADDDSLFQYFSVNQRDIEIQREEMMLLRVKNAVLMDELVMVGANFE